MTQIIGFAGKKQSGKNTCCNFILMLKLLENGVCKNARLNTDGNIEVSDIFGERIKNTEWFLFQEPFVHTKSLLDNMGEVKIYAFADSLKRIAIDVLGLEEKLVYGSDTGKMKRTHLLWQNMPGVITNERWYKSLASENPGIKKTFIYHTKGPMTVRQVLQFLGTEVFRKMYEDVWVESLFRKISAESPKIALICDVRFDNEILAIKEKPEAIVIGLEKDIYESKDTHASERVNLTLCHKVIQNGNLSIEDQNREVYLALKQSNCKHLTDLGI